MIKSSDILKMINDESADLSKQELEEIIETEMQKSEDEMDADLIEYCLDALDELKEKEKDGGSRERVKLKKAVAFLVAAVLMLAGTFCAAAVFNRGEFDFLSSIAKPQISDASRLKDELSKKGIENPVLPKVLLSEESEVKKMDFDGEVSTVDFNLNGEKISLEISDDIKKLPHDISDPTLSANATIFTVENYEISVVSRENNCIIFYENDRHLFTITVPFEFERAIEFAKTIE